MGPSSDRSLLKIAPSPLGSVEPQIYRGEERVSNVADLSADEALFALKSLMQRAGLVRSTQNDFPYQIFALSATQYGMPDITEQFAKRLSQRGFVDAGPHGEAALTEFVRALSRKIITQVNAPLAYYSEAHAIRDPNSPDHLQNLRKTVAEILSLPSGHLQESSSFSITGSRPAVINALEHLAQISTEARSKRAALPINLEYMVEISQRVRRELTLLESDLIFERSQHYQLRRSPFYDPERFTAANPRADHIDQFQWKLPPVRSFGEEIVVRDPITSLGAPISATQAGELIDLMLRAAGLAGVSTEALLPDGLVLLNQGFKYYVSETAEGVRAHFRIGEENLLLEHRSLVQVFENACALLFEDKLKNGSVTVRL